jgi:hypothetical protein
MTGVQSLVDAKDFSSSLCIQTGSGAEPAYYPVYTDGFSPKNKAELACDADLSPPLVSRTIMSRSYL